MRARLGAAGRAAYAYLGHVLSESGGAAHHGADARALRWTLRREAYRALAESRTAIALAAAELPALARHTEGADDVVATLERLVDTTTACAVHLDDSGRLTPWHLAQLNELLDELAEERDQIGLRMPDAPDVPLAG